jgi:phage N-6-adenine-methyltransferase
MSTTHLWETPQTLFDKLNNEFHFTLDVCALAGNAKCTNFYSPLEDGLKQDWTGTCWMNPPYGYSIGKWVQKAFKAAQEGATVVALLPARTDTRWWHSFVMKARDIRFLAGRLRFSNAPNSAPFPNAIVIWGGGSMQGRSVKYE